MENVVENFENSEVKLSQLAIENLRRTIPWMKFFSIVGFVLCGLMVLISIAMFIGITTTMGAFAGFAAILYLLVALVMFFVNKYLFDYSKGLQSFFQSKDATNLEIAFDMQRKFWKLVGIITIVYIGLIVFAMLFFTAFATMFSF